MTTPSAPTLRTGKLCYLEIPASDVHGSARFYERAFGWTIRHRDTDRPSFDDTTGEVSGARVTGRAPASGPGILPYVMVASDTVAAAFRDPSGNLMGIFQQPGLEEAER